MGFTLPARITAAAVRSYRPFSPLPAGTPRPAVLFSVALSVKFALSESPRPLAGMLPYGDRTFLPPVWVAPHEASGCPSGRPASIMGGRIGEGQSGTDILGRPLCKSLEMTKHIHAVEHL